MRGSRVAERVRRHVDAQNEALNCLAAGRLVALPGRPLRVPTTFDVQLGGTTSDDLQLVPLRGDEALLLDVQQKLLVGSMQEYESSPLVIAYTYRLLLRTDERRSEVVAFHWTPDSPPPQPRHPHLHVGSLVTSGSPFRGGDFNKLHIPTGPLSLEAILLFAVEELGVEPARGRDRAAVIDQLWAGHLATRHPTS